MISIINFFKKYNFHFILVLPYIIFYTYTKNLEIVNFKMIVNSLFFSLIGSIISFFILKLFFKINAKTALFTTVFFFLLATYGVFYDFIKYLYFNNWWPFEHIHRFLITSYFITLLLVSYYIKKSKYQFYNINIFLNTVFLFLIIFNLFTLINFNFNNSVIKSNKKTITSSNKIYPNIYYFILDGYANHLVLEKFYNFKNKIFLNDLNKKEFYIQDSIYSNFYTTDNSLKSTLNLNTSTKRTIYDNFVFENLKKNNYTINILKSGYTVTDNFLNVDNLIKPKGLNEFEQNLMQNTIFRIDDVVGNSYYNRLINQFEVIDNFINNRSNQFNFFHIVAPHPPYVFDQNGNKIIKINTEVNDWEPKKYYINQLIYVNKVIQKKITKIIDNNPKAIIIIQSDHGPFVSSKNPEETFEARALILNAIYGPEELKESFKTTHSSVNTFVHLFNYLFNEKIPIKKDEYTDKENFMNSTLFKSKMLKK
jgi:hypothetical protein